MSTFRDAVNRLKHLAHEEATGQDDVDTALRRKYLCTSVNLAAADGTIATLIMKAQKACTVKVLDVASGAGRTAGATSRDVALATNTGAGGADTLLGAQEGAAGENVDGTATGLTANQRKAIGVSGTLAIAAGDYVWLRSAKNGTGAAMDLSCYLEVEFD
mgnify:CR=1 FL=1